MTYLAQFSDAKLAEGAPIREDGGDPSKVKAYGDGLKPEGLSATEESVEFYVDVSEAKPFGSLRVNITSPSNTEIRPEVSFNDNIYTFRYSPGEPGTYRVSITWWGKPINGSPFLVNVSKGGVSPRHTSARSSLSPTINVYGSGVEGTNLTACEPVGFWVEGVPSNSTLQIKVVGPNGQLKPDNVAILEIAKGIYYVLYYLQVSGAYKISVCIAGKDVAQSPYTVNVGEKSSFIQGWARGPGVDGTNIEIGAKTWFNVFVPTGSNRDVIVEIEGPKGKVTATQEKSLTSVFKYTYVPKHSGKYKITVIIGPKGKTITLYFIVFAPSSSARGSFKIWGKGISPRGVQARQKTEVYVQPPTADQEVEFTIIGEEGESIPFSDSIEKGIATFNYIPPVVGCYTVNILSQGELVHNNPFKVNVTDVSKVTISGDNIDGSPVPLKKKVTYKIDAKKAGKGQLACQPLSIESGGKSSLSPKITDSKDGTYEITFTPTTACEEELLFTFDDTPLPQSPIKVNVVDVSQVKVYGRGIQKGNVAQRLTSFTVDASKAGSGKLEAAITGPGPTPITITPSSDANNVFNCEYTPPLPGDYNAVVTFTGIETKGSPYKFKILPGDGRASSRVAVYGPAIENSITVGSSAELFVAPGSDNLSNVTVCVKTPEGEEKVKPKPIKENEVMQYSFPVYQPGPYTISVDVDGNPVEGSPFTTESVFPQNLPKVAVSGKGLREAFVNEQAEFVIDTHWEGSGSLDVSVNGPAGAETTMEGIGDGKVAVKYQPKATGDYHIDVSFNKQAIPGSPFPVSVMSRDGKEKKTEVIKLEATGVRLGTDFTYSINTSKVAGPVSLTGKVLGPFKKENVPEPLKSHNITVQSFPKVTGNLPVIEPNVSEKDKIYTVAFTPSSIGVYLVYIFFGDRLVDKMPYEVCVCDPTKIKLSGPGLGKNTNENRHIGNPLTWEADCCQAGPGTLNAYVGGPDNCTKDVVVEQGSSPDQYNISYTPNEPGGYQLLFAYSGFQLSEKPTVMISDPSKAQLGQKGNRVCLVGEKVSFPLNLSAAGAGRLQASLAGPVEVPIEYNKGPNNTCTFSFTPTEVGKYTLDVSFGNKPLSDEPMEVTAINPSRVSVYGPGVTGLEAKVNHSAPVYVDLSESGVAPVSVTLKAPNNEVSQLELTPNSKDGTVFETAYVPSVIGYHELSIEYAGNEIEGSPFKVPIADPSEIKFSDGALPNIVPGESLKLDFFTESAGPGVLTGLLESLDSPEAEPLDATVTELSDRPGHYQVAFFIPGPGKYSATVKYNDIPAYVCSPIEVSGEQPDVVECEVDGPGVSRKVAVGRRTHFTIKMNNNVPKEPLSVEIRSPDNSTVPATVTGKGKSYEVEYTPAMTGEHSINIAFGNSPDSNSPYKTDAVDVSQMSLSTDTAGRSFKPGETIILLADVSMANDGDYNIDVQGPEDCLVTTEETIGIKSFSLAPKKPGVYSIMATYDDLPVTEEPLWILVADTDSIGISGNGVTGFGLGPGQKGVVEIDLSKLGEAEAADLTGTLTTPSGDTAPLRFKPNEDNPHTFTADYVPTEPGEHTLAINLHDVPITDSPIRVPIQAEGGPIIAEEQAMALETSTDVFAGNPLFDMTDTSQINAKVEGPAIEQEKLQAGLETCFTVDMSAAMTTEKPEVTLKSPDTLTLETTTSETSPGVYNVTFTPEKGGNHQLDVKACGQPISESPYNLQVFNPSAVQCMNDSPVRVAPGTPVNLEYDISNAGPGSFKLNVTGPEESAIVPTTNDENPYLLSFTFTPNTPGVYEANATFEDVPISEEPLKIKAIGDVKPGDIKVEGDAVAEAALNNENVIDLFIPMVVPEEVSMEWMGPDHSEIPLDFTVEPVDTDHCRIKFKPETEGTFEANLTYAGNPLFDEPMNITVGDVSKATVSGPAVEDEKLQAGNETTVTVNTTETGAVKPKVSVKGPDNEEITTEYQLKSPGIYDVTFTPEKGGNHQLDVKACGQPISESPYNLQVFNPSAVQCMNDSPVRVTPGTPVNLEYDISNAGPGSFKLDISGPEECTIVPKTNDENPNLLSFTFTPNTPGVYEANATFEDVPISEEPLKIKAIGDIKPGDIKVEGDGINDAALNNENVIDLYIPMVVPEEVSMEWMGPDHSEIPLNFTVEPVDADHCRIKFKPETEGTFEANLTYAGNPLFEEPWKVTVGDVSKATVSGPAVEDGKLQAGNETTVTVNTTETGAVKPKVSVKGPDNEEIATEYQLKSPGVYDVTFTPEKGGNHQLNVKACGQPISESPYNLQVFNPSAVQCMNDSPVRVAPGTPVNLEYDISNAGPGSFKLNVTGPEESAIVPTTNDENPYLLSFMITPNTPGVYEAHATFEDVPISEEPLKIKAIGDVKPGDIKVEGDAVADAALNNENVIDLFIPMVVPEEVSMEWMGPDHSEIPLDFTVEPVDTDHCRIKFKPETEGTFEANLTYAGNPLFDEPMNITVGDVSKATVSGPAVEDEKLQAGNETTATVNTTETGAVKPKVSVKGPDNEEITTEYQLKSPGVYDITFTPEKGGNHQLDVKACGQPISESPYTLQVFNPSAVQCMNDSPVRVTPGTPVNLEYDISNAGPGSFKLDTSGPEECTIVPKTNDENPNLLSFTFTPNTPGVYEANATFEDVPISEEPLRIKAIGDVKPGDIKMEGDAVADAALNNENVIDLYIPMVVPEEVSMEWMGPDHSEIPLDFTVEPVDTDHCRIKFKPETEGTFEANITYAGNPLFEEPWKVTVGDVSKATVSGPAVEDGKLQAGNETTVTINTTETGAVKPKVSVKGPDNEEITTEYQLKSPGVYDITFTPEKGGNHQLDVKACGQPISESPYNLQVFNPSAVQCMNDSPVKVAPGTPVNLEYDISNAGPGSFKLDISGPEECTIVPKTNDENPNLISFTFTPETTGVFTAQATFEDVPISEEPLKVKAIREVSPDEIQLEGDAITEAALNIDNIIDMFLPMVVTEEVDVVWMTPDHSELPLEYIVEPRDTDHCRIKYKPDEEGTFEANITYAGNPLFEEPWKVTVGDVSKATVSGPAVEDEKLQAGNETTVTVNTTETGAVKPKVSVKGPDNEEITTECQLKSPGVYDVTFTPEKGGNHQLDVKACGQPISESPYNLQIFNPSAVQCMNDSPVRVAPGTPVNLEYDISNAGPGSFKLNVTGPEESAIVPTTNDENPYLLSFTITPNTPGVYEANATFEDVPISEEPLKIKAIGDVKPGDIKVEGDAVADAALNTENVIDLYIPMVVAEEVSMEWMGPDHSEIPLDFTVEPVDTDHCRIKFKPETEGTFEANLTYAGNPLFDEPMNITVGDVSKATVSGPAVEGERKLQAGVETYITVDTTGTGAVKPKVSVKGPDNEEIATEYQLKSPGVYDITFTPEKGGNHQLDVKACGQPISESPYNLQVFNPSAVQCMNDSPVRVTPGTPVNLEYDISNAGPGSFKLVLAGPEETAIVPATDDENPYLLSFTFTPNTPGVYEAHATFEAVNIADEPLKIFVVDYEQLAISGSGVTGKKACVGEPVEITVDTSKSGPLPLKATLKTPQGETEELNFSTKEDNPDMLVASYTPTVSGYYDLTFSVDEEDIYKEPLRPYVVNPAEFQVVKEEEIRPLEAMLGQVNSHEVFVENGVQDEASFGVLLLTEDEADMVEAEIECKVAKLDDEHIKIEYLPELETAQYVVLTYNEVPISEKLPIARFDTTECSVVDLKTSVPINTEASFSVAGIKSQKYQVVAMITQENGDSVEANVEMLESAEEEDGKGLRYRISYTPTKIGLLTIVIKYGTISICEAMTVSVFDASLVVCTGLEGNEVLVGEKVPFAVDASKAGSGAELIVNLEGPETSSVLCQAVSDGHYSGVLSSERAGACHLCMTYGGVEIGGSTFVIRYNRPEPDATKCSVSNLQTPGKFFIDCRDGGGNGILEVAIYGAFVPAKYIAVEHNGDYTFNVQYDIPDPVETFISVKWHGIHLQGSPFAVNFEQ